ncbi:MAG: DoxX family protein [Ktedonobacterales bacterium]
MNISIASLSLGLLTLRIVAGLTVGAHGAQKLLGWFGGNSFAGTLKMQERIGFQPAWLWSCLVILGELGGGLSLTLGFLTPLGAAGVLGVMLMAILKSHWQNGFWNSKRGWEFPVQLLSAGAAIGFCGPGHYSLDYILGISLPYPQLFLLLALAALVVDAIGLQITRQSLKVPASVPPTS